MSKFRNFNPFVPLQQRQAPMLPLPDSATALSLLKQKQNLSVCEGDSTSQAELHLWRENSKRKHVSQSQA
eukprot:g75101.t1